VVIVGTVAERAAKATPSSIGADPAKVKITDPGATAKMPDPVVNPPVGDAPPTVDNTIAASMFEDIKREAKKVEDPVITKPVATEPTQAQTTEKEATVIQEAVESIPKKPESDLFKKTVNKVIAAQQVVKAMTIEEKLHNAIEARRAMENADASTANVITQGQLIEALTINDPENAEWLNNQLDNGIETVLKYNKYDPEDMDEAEDYEALISAIPDTDLKNVLNTLKSNANEGTHYVNQMIKSVENDPRMQVKPVTAVPTPTAVESRTGAKGDLLKEIEAGKTLKKVENDPTPPTPPSESLRDKLLKKFENVNDYDDDDVEEWDEDDDNPPTPRQ